MAGDGIVQFIAVLISPDMTLKKVSLPRCGSIRVLKTKSALGPFGSQASSPSFSSFSVTVR